MADPARATPTFGRAWRGPAEVTFNVLVLARNNQLAQETNIPFHVLVIFIFPALLGFLQIKYTENPTPFELYPNTTLVSIASFIVYCLAFWGRLRFATWAPRLGTLMVIFGSLSVVSLVSMLLPDSWVSIRFVMFTLWLIGHVLAMVRTHVNVTRLRPQEMRRRVRPLLPTTTMDLN